MKGIVFTLDALFALMITAAGIAVILYFTYSAPTASVIQYSSTSQFVNEMGIIPLSSARGIELVDMIVNQSFAYNQSWNQMLKDEYNSAGNAQGPSLYSVAYTVNVPTSSNIINGSITAGYGNVYFAAGNVLYAINATTGDYIWNISSTYNALYTAQASSTSLATPPINATLVYDGMLIYQTATNTTALSAYNGSVIWTAPVPYISYAGGRGDQANAHILEYDGVLLISGFDQSHSGYPLYALYANNGTLAGTSSALIPSKGGQAQSYAIIGGGDIAIGNPQLTNGNDLYLITSLLNSTYDGSTIWATGTSGDTSPFSAGIATYENVIGIEEGSNANLYSISGGTPIMSTAPCGTYLGGVSSYLGAFVFQSQCAVTAFTPSGTPLWSTTVPAAYGNAPLNATPIQSSTNIYTIWSNGYISAMNRSTGAIVQSVQVPFSGSINPYMALAYDKLFASVGTKLIAFGTCQSAGNASMLSDLGTMYINNEGSCADYIINAFQSTQNSGFLINNKSITTVTQLGGQPASNVTIPYSSTINSYTNGPYSVSLWFNNNAIITTSDLIDTTQPQGHTLEIQFIGGSNPLVNAQIGTGSKWLTQTAKQGYKFRQNTWYNLVLSVSSTGYAIYINGNEVQGTYSSSGTPSLLDGASFIELGSAGNANGFKGSIADFQIYDTSLSASQADQIYLSGVSGPMVSETSAVDWFPLAGDANGYGNQMAPGFASQVVYNDTGYTPISIPNSDSISSQSTPAIVLNYTTGVSKLYDLGLYSWR